LERRAQELKPKGADELPSTSSEAEAEDAVTPAHEVLSKELTAT
jgi:hypothetical protein